MANSTTSSSEHLLIGAEFSGEAEDDTQRCLALSHRAGGPRQGRRAQRPRRHFCESDALGIAGLRRRGRDNLERQGAICRSQDEAGHRRVVRHGHLPEREIMPGIGPAVRQPQVCDREAGGGERIYLDLTSLPAYAGARREIATYADPLYPSLSRLREGVLEVRGERRAPSPTAHPGGPDCRYPRAGNPNFSLSST